MKTKYYNYYPRRFGNEYTTIKATNEEDDNQLLLWADKLDYTQSNFERVTVAELRKMASNERQARKYDQSFSGYCCPWNPVSVNDFLNPIY